MADDEEECVRALAEQLDAWGTERIAVTDDDEEIVVPGVLCAVLLDVGCLHCSEPTVVRAVMASAEDWRDAFLLECRRLEIDREGIRTAPVPFAEFLRAGGSAAVAGVPYRRIRDEDGARVSRFLALIVSRIL